MVHRNRSQGPALLNWFCRNIVRRATYFSGRTHLIHLIRRRLELLMPPIIDIHIHIQPLHLFKPEALALIKKGRKNFAEIERYSADPQAFLGFLDSVGVERAGLINYVAPEVIGFRPEVNDWCAKYCSAAPDRLIAFGSVHPLYVPDAGAEVDRLARIGIRGLKVHPSHQEFSPNAYRDGFGPLAAVYERAQATACR